MRIEDHLSGRGFSLVELLIVAAVVGLIVAIAIPNLVNAIQKARQARTLADANTIANGCGLYNQDFAMFPWAAEGSTAAVLLPHLEPYIESLTAMDGWRREYRYTSTEGDSYTLVSLGLGGELNQPWTAGTTSHFTDDIVLIDGAFFQFPDGPQQ